MADQKSAGRPLDATGTTVRKNIRRIRDELGLSAPELSQRLNRLGRPIPPLGINRIEKGTRRVDVDDLVVIAAALGVSPATLLMPARNEDDSEVKSNDLVPIAGWGAARPITARVVWQWLTAADPLVHGTMSSFVRHALPSWERERVEAEISAIQRRNRDELYRKVPDDGDD